MVPVTLVGPGGRITLWGLVDTGAEDVLLDPARLTVLGLVPLGETQIDTAGGAKNELTYQAQILLAGRDLGRLTVVALEPSAEVPLIVGRAVLRFFRLVFDGPGGTLDLL